MKLSEIVKAYEDGKTIEFEHRGEWSPVRRHKNQIFGLNTKYRIKETPRAIQFRVALFRSSFFGDCYHTASFSSVEGADSAEKLVDFVCWLGDWHVVEIEQ